MNIDEKIQRIIGCKDEIDEIIHKNYHNLAKKYDLSLEQFHLLIELDELMLDAPDDVKLPTVGQIAKNINNSQNTVSERISRLENKGLVKRVKDLKDKRISRVVLTDDGRKLIHEMGSEAESMFLFDSISRMKERDIDDLLECLEKLIKHMKER